MCDEEAFGTTGVMMEGGWLGGLARWCNEGQGNIGVYTTPAKRTCCGYDPCGLIKLGNGGATELTYAHTLQRHFANTLNWKPRFLIDTGRNGAAEARSRCAGWCNSRHAGAGHVPSMNTGLPDVVDAFWWLKTPGESRGCTRLLPGGFS